MRLIVGSILVSLLAACPPAQACSPAVNYVNRPLAMKLEGNGFFIGKIESVDAGNVIMTVITPGGPAKDRKAGDTIPFKRGSYGTCGSLNFEKGEIWLYDGSDISFSSSRKLEPADLKDGNNLDVVKRNLVARLDPGYKPPRAPAKDDLPVPGAYAHSEACGESDKAQGRVSLDYVLTITGPAADTYKVAIESKGCREKSACSFSGEAPAYGYGEIIVPLATQKDDPAYGCSVMVQQLSAVNEWPRLEKGQSRVRLNDFVRCMPFVKTCESNGILDSPLLLKQ